jgi:hypothetical protein
MTYENRLERPDQVQPDAVDGRVLDNCLQDAADVRPGTFRYSDQGLGGEVRTSVPQDGGISSVAQAEVYRRDGSVDTVGTARYSVAGDSATIHNQPFVAANEGVKNALVSEISEQARARGATRLQGWAPDGDTDAVQRWQRLGFQPTQRAPDAPGVFYERPI